MNRYILIQSIGPVQGFIAAARRNRDLWCGSWLLSEIAKAAALHLLRNKAELIFPAETDEKKLTDKNFSVGNKIQACVTAADSDAVRQLAAATAEAARQRFITLATEARAKLGDAACAITSGRHKSTTTSKYRRRGRTLTTRRTATDWPANGRQACWRHAKPPAISCQRR